MSTANIESLEDSIARPLRLDRIYRRWDNATPGDRERATLLAGRVPVVSFNGRLPEPEGPVSWASVAAGERDSDLVLIADAFRDLAAPVFALYHQNPDDDTDEFGSSEEYQAAFRRTVSVFREREAHNVSWVWSLRSTAFSSRASEFYPGDDVVDWIGANAYNYGTESDGSRWISLRALLSDFVQWSRQHDKPLMLAEFGCVEDATDPGRKAAWIDAVVTTLQSEPRIRAAIYFHRPNEPMAADSSPAAFDAFRLLAADPYMNY